ncbi:MAG: PQQ-binding-like beta-propeller repeat protein [Phycisphaerae bacterium]
MRNPPNAGSNIAIICLFIAALPLAAVGQKAEPAGAKQILDLAGVRSGLCIHLGCGRETSASLTADMAAASGMAVHAIAMDDASLARARKAIEAQGMSGRAMAEKADLKALPYLRDLADLVVIEDFDALAAKGLKMEEVMRVVAPGGAVCTLKDGKWTKVVKPRPAEMDEWTHPNHGPDGNMVSQDKIVRFPLGLRWIDGLPMNVNKWASCRAWVSAGGRLFTLTANVLENIGPQKNKPLYLCAQDAWNGLPLWKVNCETSDDGGFLNSVNVGTLVTDGKRVYTVLKDQLVGFDAATGAKAVTFAAKYPAVRLALLDGVLVASCWEAKGQSKAPCDQGDVWGTWVPKGDVGTVEAFDAATGAPKWSRPEPAQQLLAADGTVYLMVQKDNPPSERTIVAVDLATGKERWKAAHTRFGENPDIQLNTAGKGYAIISKRGDAQGLGKDKNKPADPKPRLRAIFGLAASDGKTLWQISPAKSYWTPVVDGAMWYQGKKHDPLTGQEKGNIGWGVGDQFCTPQAIVNNYIVQPRGGQYVQLPEEGSPAKALRYTGARGACIEGMVPANGMFYTAQNNCQCMPGQVYGFVAIGPVGALPVLADFEKPRAVEKGPAFGESPTGGAIDDNAWPTYRADAERTASSKCQLPAKLKELWRAPAAKPAEGPLAEAWRMRLGSCLSAPTVAGNMAFVAAVDAGQVIAIDAAGKPAWKVSLGGRIDTPPTFHKGLCLVGSHDGYVYALRAKDGELVWRLRVAPQDRRMVAYAQVESVWPAVGTVLVHDGVAYANAGRTTDSDGGIAVVAFDPATGAPAWAKPIATGQRMNDLLAIRDGQIAWYNNRMDPKTGNPQPAATFPKDPSQGGMLDGTWTAFKFRRPGKGFTAGKVTANILAWNDKLIVGPDTAVTRQGDQNAWTTPFPKGQQVEAIALAANAAVFAGRTADAAGKPVGFLAVLSATDGKPMAEIKLSAPPTFDGLAVAAGRVYVSLQDGNLICFGNAD